jgi:hypothetical protein
MQSHQWTEEDCETICRYIISLPLERDYRGNELRLYGDLSQCNPIRERLPSRRSDSINGERLYRCTISYHDTLLRGNETSLSWYYMRQSLNVILPSSFSMRYESLVQERCNMLAMLPHQWTEEDCETICRYIIFLLNEIWVSLTALMMAIGRGNGLRLYGDLSHCHWR